MRAAVRTGTFALVVLASAGAAPRVVAAQATQSAGELAVSREQFQAGMAAARAGRWEEARGAFERAYAIARRPLILLNLAGAQAQTGQLVLAAEGYRQFLREATTPPASEHRVDAETALAALEPRIPRATIRAAGLRPGDEVRLDGRALNRATLGVPLPVDPGEHAIELVRGGQVVGRAALRLAERERRDAEVAATLTVTAAPAAPAGATDAARSAAWAGAPAPAAPREGPPRRGGVLSSPVFWVITGLVVAGGVTAGVYFAVTTPGAAPPPYMGTLMPGVVSVR